MAASSLAIAGLSKNGGAENCTDRTENRAVSALQEAISNLLRHQNPRKTWAFLAAKFGLKERAAKHRLANNSSYTIEELQFLFQSENGRAYLDAMMADAEPTWWKAVRASIQLSEARVLQEQARQAVLALDNAPLEQPTRRKIKRVIDADRSLNALRAEKELAAGFLHQNAAGVADRMVAQAQSAAARTPALRAYAGRER